MIAQLTIHTSNSVDLLAQLPLGDLFELYEAVLYEFEQAKLAREEARNG